MEDQDTRETIVIVDDEEMVLTSLSSFLSLETDYHVETFISARDALEYVKNNGVDLVVSDYLMPEMDGISFLAEVKKVKPEVPRIILTGYADKENAIKAINDVGLFQPNSRYSGSEQHIQVPGMDYIRIEVVDLPHYQS